MRSLVGFASLATAGLLLACLAVGVGTGPDCASGMVSTLPGLLVLRSPLRLVGLWLFHSANSLSCSKTATRMSFTTSPVGRPMNST